MTLSRRNIFAALVIALPPAIAVLVAVNWIDQRDRAGLLEQIAQSHVNEVIHDACVNDPQWFLAGTRLGRPKPEERLQPDADVHLPRPKADPFPFEYFAYDEELVPTSVAGPRFPDAFKRALRAVPHQKMVTGEYSNALGAGLQTAIETNWTPGPCAVLLFRQIAPANAFTTKAALFAGIYLVCFAIAWVAAAPTTARIRRLSREAKDSTRDDYAAMVKVSGSDEISSLAAVFNDSAADIRRKATDARDREEALRRYVEHTTEEVAPPLAALEQRIASLGAPDAVREMHRLVMALTNQASVTRLRAVSDSSPREAVDLAAVVKTLVASRAALAQICGVAIDASKAGTKTIVQADPQLMQQAVANLLDNAVIYNRAGGVVRVELASYDQGRRFRLLVADNGPGVSEEHFAGLAANKRFRGDEARTRRPGDRGLGLALAREIADRFGMQLDLRQPAGGGFEAEIATRS